MSSFWQLFDVQMVIFRKVRSLLVFPIILSYYYLINYSWKKIAKRSIILIQDSFCGLIKIKEVEYSDKFEQEGFTVRGIMTSLLYMSQHRSGSGSSWIMLIQFCVVTYNKNNSRQQQKTKLMWPRKTGTQYSHLAGRVCVTSQRRDVWWALPRDVTLVTFTQWRQHGDDLSQAVQTSGERDNLPTAAGWQIWARMGKNREFLR